MHANSVLLIQDGTNMARPKDNKKKSNDYRGGSALLKKQQEANTKKFKAMTPAQKKTYVAKQAKTVGKTAAQVASMVGGAGLARKAAAKVAVPSIKKAAAKSVEKKSLKAANAPSKNQAASDSGRRYMGQKFMKVEDAGKDRYGQQKVSIKRNTEKLKEATTPRTPGGTVRLNPRFARNLRKGK
jgi:hypothetical protein